MAVATCRAVPDVDADGPALLTALIDAGMPVDVCVWDDSAVDWSAYQVVLIRSTLGLLATFGGVAEVDRAVPPHHQSSLSDQVEL